jgi:hypothetical protein
MFSVMVIFKSSVVWGLFQYTDFFIAPQAKKKSGAQKFFYHPVLEFLSTPFIVYA